MDSKKIYIFMCTVEVILTVGAGFFISLSLKNYDLALTATILGSLVTFATFAIPLRVSHELEKYFSNLDNYFEILRVSLSIDKYPTVKQNILAKCLEDLKNLSEGIVYGEEYYQWLYSQTNQCKTSIQAISSMSGESWEIHEEKQYYEANREAKLSREVDVERIFIPSKNSLKDKLNRKIIVKHLIDNIRVFIVPQNQLFNSSVDGIKKGITIFDGKTIFLDVDLPPEKAGGKLLSKLKDRDDFKARENEYKHFRPHDSGITFEKLSDITGITVKELHAHAVEIIRERHSIAELRRKVNENCASAMERNDYQKWTMYGGTDDAT